MKKLTFIFSILFLTGCLFISTDILSKSLFRHTSIKKEQAYERSFTYNPNLLNTFNYLFPIYSFDKEVCRKPADFGSSFLKINPPFNFGGYRFGGFLEKDHAIGTHFLDVEGNSIYKNGNSLLLVPHSFIMPTSPSFHSEVPRIVIPKSN